MAKKKSKSNWISGAVQKKGALREQLGVKEGETIPASKLTPKEGDSATTARRKNLARTLRRLNKNKKSK